MFTAILSAMTVGVVGTGRFGAFWATLLSSRHTVVTYNRSRRPVPEGCTGVEIEELSACDAVFLCVAISSIAPVLEQLAPHLQAGCVVLDTCSVKVYPMKLMSELLGDAIESIGTHPMFGPDSARNGVDGLPLVFTPLRCSDDSKRYWREEFLRMGLDVRELTAEEHDKEAAFTQGVTHFIGRVLADMQLRPSEIATVGYQQLLSVTEQTCNDPYQLFEDLQHYNPYTPVMRRSLQQSLNRLMESLESRLDTRG